LHCQRSTPFRFRYTTKSDPISKLTNQLDHEPEEKNIQQTAGSALQRDTNIVGPDASSNKILHTFAKSSRSELALSGVDWVKEKLVLSEAQRSRMDFHQMMRNLQAISTAAAACSGTAFGKGRWRARGEL
jgi:hypothetical protein